MTYKAMNNMSQPYKESLKTTLNCFQLSSQDSLSGPSSFPGITVQMLFKGNSQTPLLSKPFLQIPVLMPNDTNSTPRSETLLCGEVISCFIIGGEKRLCLPQILTTVLKQFSIAEINQICTDLHIYCSRCTPEQLELLKVIRVLPFNTTQCGLITKSDAERLVATLGVDCYQSGRYDIKMNKTNGIPVYHECFGKGDGVFYPDLYIAPDSNCITCCNCGITFPPMKFVSHSHRYWEKRTCHWGFDPENWRNYILVPRDIAKEKRKMLEKELKALKKKFGHVSMRNLPPASNFLKRKQREENEVSKKVKKEKPDEPTFAPSVCGALPCSTRQSAFKPFSNAALPVSVLRVSNLQAAQEEALRNEFGTLLPNRRLLPGYLQSGSPASLVDTDTPSTAKWFAALKKAQDVPSIRLASAEEQRRTSSLALDQKRRETSKQSILTATPPEVTPHSPCQISSRKVTSHVETEISDSSIKGADRRSSEEFKHVSDSSVKETTVARPGSDPVFLKDDLPFSATIKSSSHVVANRERNRDAAITNRFGLFSKSHDEEIQVVKDASKEQRKPHHEEESPPSQRSNVAAVASTMLELSSFIKKDRKKTSRETSSINSSRESNHKSPPPLLHMKQRSSLHNDRSNTDVQSPLITSMDDKRMLFKWTLLSSSFIISATGTSELKSFHSLLGNSGCSKTLMDKLMLELVKIKAQDEETLRSQARLPADIESEVERLRLSRKKSIDDDARCRKELRSELEKMRDNHLAKMKETNQSLINLGKQAADLKKGCEERDALQHKILDRLHKQIDDGEETVHRLEKQLLDERERRLLAEKKLEELVDGSRRRISLLMEGDISP